MHCLCFEGHGFNVKVKHLSELLQLAEAHLAIEVSTHLGLICFSTFTPD